MLTDSCIDQWLKCIVYHAYSHHRVHHPSFPRFVGDVNMFLCCCCCWLLAVCLERGITEKVPFKVPNPKPPAPLSSWFNPSIPLAQLAPDVCYVHPPRTTFWSNLMILFPANTSLGGRILTYFKARCNDAWNRGRQIVPPDHHPWSVFRQLRAWFGVKKYRWEVQLRKSSQIFGDNIIIYIYISWYLPIHLIYLVYLIYSSIDPLIDKSLLIYLTY